MEQERNGLAGSYPLSQEEVEIPSPPGWQILQEEKIFNENQKKEYTHM